MPDPCRSSPPTDRDWHTDELPATPQRDFSIPADAVGRGAGGAAATRRRPRRSTSSRTSAGSGATCCGGRARPCTADARYMAIAADDLAERWTFRLFPTESARATVRTDACTRASARGRRHCVTPAERPENPFAATGVGHAVRAWAVRITTRGRSAAALELLGRDARIGRALDVACGTGHVDGRAAPRSPTLVVGVDVSPEMLARRAAGTRACAHARPPRRCRSRPASFDAVTCAPACTGSTSRGSSPKLRRVLRPGGWVGLYDHYFIGEMVDVPEFPAWARDAARRAIRCRRATRRSAIRAPRRPRGFENVGDDFFADDIDDDASSSSSTTSCRSATSSPPGSAGTPRDELRDVAARVDVRPFYAGVDDAHRAVPRRRSSAYASLRSRRRNGFPPGLRGISSTMTSSAATSRPRARCARSRGRSSSDGGRAASARPRRTRRRARPTPRRRRRRCTRRARGVMREDTFDFGRAHVDAAGDDEVLLADRRRARVLGIELARRRRSRASRRRRARVRSGPDRAGSRASPSRRGRRAHRRLRAAPRRPRSGCRRAPNRPTSRSCRRRRRPGRRAVRPAHRSAGGHGAPPTITRRYSCIGAPASSRRRKAVGTTDTIVGPRRAAPRAHRAMSKPSCTVHGTPVTNARASTPRLATWCNGRHASQRSPGPAPSPLE